MHIFININNIQLNKFPKGTIVASLKLSELPAAPRKTRITRVFGLA
jgi:hypothetical protein